MQKEIDRFVSKKLVLYKEIDDINDRPVFIPDFKKTEKPAPVKKKHNTEPHQDSPNQSMAMYGGYPR